MYMDSKQLAEIAAEACDDRKAKDIQLIQIEKVSSLTDWIIVAEGLSDINVKAIVISVEQKLQEKASGTESSKTLTVEPETIRET